MVTVAVSGIGGHVPLMHWQGASCVAPAEHLALAWYGGHALAVHREQFRWSLKKPSLHVKLHPAVHSKSPGTVGHVAQAESEAKPHPDLYLPRPHEVTLQGAQWASAVCVQLTLNVPAGHWVTFEHVLHVDAPARNEPGLHANSQL